MLEQLGARGIDADALAHVVMQRGSAPWRAIVDTFGADILLPSGRIDRRKLSARVFADAAALRQLEAIVHPAVGALTKELLRETRQPVAVVEAIKLVEAGMHQWCDALWAVTCAPEVQIARVLQTRNLREEDARARLAAQGAYASNLRLAQVIIDNNGDESATRAQVEKAWRAIHPASARDKSAWLLGVEPPPEPAAAPAVETPRAPLPPVETLAQPSAPVAAKRDIQVRRSRRADLDALSAAIAKHDQRAEPLSRDEALKRLGERGYRIAVADNHIVGLAAWEAENLVACVRELWAESVADGAIALPRLFELIENEARELLCEVVLLLIDAGAPDYIVEQAQASNYELLSPGTLQPVWRQVVQERLQPGDRIWGKRLTTELRTKPF